MHLPDATAHTRTSFPQDQWPEPLPAVDNIKKESGFIFPSLAVWGEARLVRISVNHPSVVRSMQYQHATSLPFLFDVMSDSTRSKRASSETKSLVKLFTLLSISMAHDYLSLSSGDDMGVTPLLTKHITFMANMSLRYERIQQLAKQAMAVARNQIKTTPGIHTSHLLEESILFFSITGVAALINLHAPNEFTGAPVSCDASRRELAYAKAYDDVNTLLGQSGPFDHDIFSHVQFALLYGKRGISRVLDCDAYPLNEDVQCGKCGADIDATSATSGLCFAYPHHTAMLCAKCTECGEHISFADENDYVFAAAHMMCSVWRMLTKYNTRRKSLQ